MDTTKFTLTKSTVECYKIRHASGMYWADITIDAKDKTGRIQIASDYGDWQYYWGACGCPFKQFLTELGIDYVAGKFGEGSHFDEEKTIRHYKQYTIEQRKTDDLSAAEAREIWEDIKFLTNNGSDKLDEFCNTMYNECHALMYFFNHQPDTIKIISPQFRMFWDNIWAFFVAALKREITPEPDPREKIAIYAAADKYLSVPVVVNGVTYSTPPTCIHCGYPVNREAYGEKEPECLNCLAKADEAKKKHEAKVNFFMKEGLI
jgi:hypothetical protein